MGTGRHFFLAIVIFGELTLPGRQRTTAAVVPWLIENELDELFSRHQQNDGGGTTQHNNRVPELAPTKLCQPAKH